MKVRTLLTFTAILSSILGAIVAYFVLTVPNDLEAGAMLKQAHALLRAGKSDEARDTLAIIVQQHPRTDGAAAATV
ncbi:MAG TPA: tetratricopeptide repeat protein, partial [Thermoanaerobaculia bacterium]|nr:tetratricopeptide repeat protein [Thermoanaerobaculia bacterium]